MFKLDDKVICIESCHCIKVGMTGIICDYQSFNEMIGVAWDDFYEGHSCSGTCNNNKGYYVYDYVIKLNDCNEKTKNVDISREFKNEEICIELNHNVNEVHEFYYNETGKDPKMFINHGFFYTSEYIDWLESMIIKNNLLKVHK